MLPTSEIKTSPLSSHVANIWNENLSTVVSFCQHLKQKLVYCLLMLPTCDMKTCPLSSHAANIWNENVFTVVSCCQHLKWKLVHCRPILPTFEMKTCPLSSHVANMWNENLSTVVSCCHHLKWKLVHCRLTLPTFEMKICPLSSHVANILIESLSTVVSCCQHLKYRWDKSVVSFLLHSFASRTDHWASTWDRKYANLSPCALSTNNRPSLCCHQYLRSAYWQGYSTLSAGVRALCFFFLYVAGLHVSLLHEGKSKIKQCYKFS
jgi:hypothetical protein